MPEILDFPKFFQYDRMTEVDIRRRGVGSQFRAKWHTGLEGVRQLRLKLVDINYLEGSVGDYLELFFDFSLSFPEFAGQAFSLLLLGPVFNTLLIKKGHRVNLCPGT